MAKIGSNYFGERPKLTPDRLEGDAAVLTVASVEAFHASGRDQIVVKFEETGDDALWLNKTMLDALLERLGDDTDGWVGERVPVEVRNVEYEGKATDKVYIMDADQWDEVLPPPGVPSGTAKSKAKSAPKPPVKPNKRK